MASRWRKLAGLPAICAALALSACAYVPAGDEPDHPAVRAADRWANRNVPGFTAQRSMLRPIAEPRGPYWLVHYDAPPGIVSVTPYILVSKFGGRIVRVDYGQ